MDTTKPPTTTKPTDPKPPRPSQRLFVACLDNSTQDMLIHLSGICDFIDRQLDAGIGSPPRESESEGYASLFPEEELQRLKKIESESWTRGGAPRVMVHCEKGYSRSPMVLIAYLMRRRKEGLDKVVQDVRGKRRMKPNPNFMEQLRVWESVEYEIWEDEGKTVPKAAYAEYLRGRKERLEEQGLTGDEPIGVQSL